MTNIILCGGSGTRLWPISRTSMPKQFVKLFSKQSLFQHTVQRNAQICSNQIIVSNSEQYFMALDQLDELGYKNNRYILEPIGRNTAPAIALACMALEPEEIVLVTPSDHLIKDMKNYIHAIKQAEEYARNNYLVTFGIYPTFPETGFGYIEADGENVKAFHEKPNLVTAQQYLTTGNYYWNSGMFCFKAGVFLDELSTWAPNLYHQSIQAYTNAIKEPIIRIRYEDMMSISDISIDYAVMEKSHKVKVIPSQIGWNDVGSFDALYHELPTDADGNTLDDNYIGFESSNNLILSDNRHISTIDVNNLIIADTEDALLICQRGSSQKVKEIVTRLKNQKTQLPNIHLTTHRPWGSYTVLENSEGYKIKRIEVKPGKRLSLQKHLHRNEHWIILSGIATVTVGEETYNVLPNESTYIKAGEIHRLANGSLTPLIIIEVQVGSYTGEDDIIRLEDDFNR